MVALVVFVITNLIPGSPAKLILGEDATSEEIEQLNHELGLDRPVPVRLLMWINDILRGDLGTSLYKRTPVSQILLNRLEATFALALLGMLVAIAIGVPLGIIAAVSHGKIADLAAMFIALIGISTPFFWLGLSLILLFSLVLGWFPSSGYTPLSVDPMDSLRHLILPAFALGFHHAGGIARMSRANLLETLRADYIRTARSKGLQERIVILLHAFRNALIPTISVIGVVAALMIGGSPVIETVFAIPGVGRLLVEGILRRDFPIVQGCVLLLAVSVALVNLSVDLIYAWLDPRISHPNS
jgi:peptide/nickel transport system permease protein